MERKTLDERIIRNDAGSIEIPAEIWKEGVYLSVEQLLIEKGDKKYIRVIGELPHSNAYNNIKEAYYQLPFILKERLDIKIGELDEAISKFIELLNKNKHGICVGELSEVLSIVATIKANYRRIVKKFPEDIQKKAKYFDYSSEEISLEIEENLKPRHVSKDFEMK